MSSWTTLSSRVAYENPYMFVREDQVINPANKEGVYGVVESKCPGVFIVPIDEDGNTYIIQQFRYTSQKMTWECVAGRNDEDDPELAAKRELREETGLIANKLTSLGNIVTANGMTTLHGTFFLAEELSMTSSELDKEDGILACKKLPLPHVIDMIMTGEIQCSESIAAFFMAREHLQRKG